MKRLEDNIINLTAISLFKHNSKMVTQCIDGEQWISLPYFDGFDQFLISPSTVKVSIKSLIVNVFFYFFKKLIKMNL